MGSLVPGSPIVSKLGSSRTYMGSFRSLVSVRVSYMVILKKIRTSRPNSWQASYVGIGFIAAETVFRLRGASLIVCMCMYTYIYIYMYTHMCIFIHAYIPTYTYGS